MKLTKEDLKTIKKLIKGLENQDFDGTIDLLEQDTNEKVLGDNIEVSEIIWSFLDLERKEIEKN